MEVNQDDKSIVSSASTDDIDGLQDEGATGGNRRMHQYQHQEDNKNRDSSGSGGANQIAPKEAKTVRRLKLLVYLVLCLAAAVVGLITFLLLAKSEDDNFRTGFALTANEVYTASERSMRSKIAALENFAVSFTSYAVDKNLTFPFVTLPDYERRSIAARVSSGADQIMWCPLVSDKNKVKWENYSVANQGWIQEGLKLQGRKSAVPDGIAPVITTDNRSNSLPFYAPVWQIGPAPTLPYNINYDNLQVPDFQNAYNNLVESGRTLISQILYIAPVYQLSYDWYKKNLNAEYFQFLAESNKNNTHLDSLVEGSYMYQTDEVRSDNGVIGNTNKSSPVAGIAHPVFDTFYPGSQLAGLILAFVPWDYFFQSTGVANVQGIYVNVDDSCGEEYTYFLNGKTSTSLGVRYQINPDFKGLAIVYNFARYASLKGSKFEQQKSGQNHTYCGYVLTFYPSSNLEDSYKTYKPRLYSVIVVLVFIFTAIVFLSYDIAVRRHKNKVEAKAAQTQAIVSSLFPQNVQDRILEQVEERAKKEAKAMMNDLPVTVNNPGEKSEISTKSKPIADLFSDTTIMFADIVGFTAWSSTREPSQVFTLLETIFAAFDQIAKRRRVFKVETIGDCYVAVCGLPEIRKDHAIVMARFARDCREAFIGVVRELEVELGPDTGELGVRIGMHSGPVTAGVLRGEKSRFQLFGDTMNTASRMESTGQKNRMQVSKETYDQLVAGEKGHWLYPREDKIVAKGKGEMQTYWLNPKNTDKGSSRSEGTPSDGDDRSRILDAANSLNNDAILQQELELNELAAKKQRLVDWNIATLLGLLKKIANRRLKNGVKLAVNQSSFEKHQKDPRSTVINEVVEVIKFTHFDSKAVKLDSIGDVELDDVVATQLRAYVSTISNLYRNHAFHNFDHASHVMLSTIKFLGYVATTTDPNRSSRKIHQDQNGITIHPLTEFSMVFSALIHDIDHPGVPNSQLVKESAPMAQVYGNASIAEQNSFDIGWGLLMDDSYSDLRRAIYVNEQEYQCFRQLVVNAVMATDLMDKELNMARTSCWDRVFVSQAVSLEEPANGVSLDQMTTIVIEHLIQAADIAHTMQHWHIYCKWNARLFEEMTMAFREGRSEQDPSEYWYENELDFFDYCVIPLAKKLKDCGFFGVASDGYLNYAQQNREEWEQKGRDVVTELVAKLNADVVPFPMNNVRAISDTFVM